MLTFTSALSDLPSPPYSHPKDYEALVDAMLQELYHLNPEWVERKRRLQQVCVLPPLLPTFAEFHRRPAMQIKAQREAGKKIDYQLLRASWAPE